MKNVLTINFDNDSELRHLFHSVNISKKTLKLGKVKNSIIKILIQHKLKKNKKFNFSQVKESISFNI
jgi:hypothetical protein